MSSRAFIDQVEALISLDYPALLDMLPELFRQRLAPLASLLPESGAATADPEQGTIPFVLVIQRAIGRSEALSRVTRRQKGAVERLHPRGVDDFQPIEGLQLPDAEAYVLVGVDRGRDSLNVTPDDALPRIRERGRQPLTIDEGIALLTHYPEFLQPNHCFYLLGSRGGDKRVPALWLSEGRPKLGWCWAGNPHTWLGTASCAARIGGVRLRDPATAEEST